MLSAPFPGLHSVEALDPSFCSALCEEGCLTSRDWVGSANAGTFKAKEEVLVGEKEKLKHTPL